MRGRVGRPDVRSNCPLTGLADEGRIGLLDLSFRKEAALGEV